jgi:hypothetical protein
MGSAAKRLGGSTMAVVTLVMILAAPAAPAATYTVNTTSDPAGAGCTGGTCSLRQAIAKVNTGLGGGDEINLPAGRVVLTLGVLSVSKPVTIAGAGARASSVDANAGNTVINFNAGSSPSAARDLTFTGGHGSGNSGINNSVNLTLTRVTVTGNVATGFASSGVYNDTAGTLTIADSTISGNSAATIGGGIYNRNVLTVINTTISGNTANTSGSNWEGGGLYTEGTTTIVNSTIAGNASFSGAGVSVEAGATATFKNTIVAQNTATGAGQPGNCRVLGTLTSQGGNLEDTNTCNYVQAGDLPSTAAGFGPLQDNGGPVDTRALLGGSAAIDRGTGGGCPATDARGVVRPQQAACDIGAYEFAPPNVTTGDASGVGVATASIAGTLLPNLRASDYHFEFGTTAGYGSRTSSIGVGSGNLPIAVSAALTGLKAATTYHYRIVGTNGDGSAAGADRTFTTRPFAGAGLHSRRLRADRKGRIPLNLSCPGGTAGGACSTVAALYSASGKLPAAAARRSRRARLLGRSRLSIPAGQTVTKRLRLSRRGRRSVMKGRATRARLLLTTRDGAGNKKTRTYRVTVRKTR